ncbi:MAG: T9SS type A sorting domain-containing protein [Prolixibacteraceae bacterium]|nr:T9SS type A sorting domain-containing protein [Prolixibacteraceae bacterium]
MNRLVKTTYLEIVFLLLCFSIQGFSQSQDWTRTNSNEYQLIKSIVPEGIIDSTVYGGTSFPTGPGLVGSNAKAGYFVNADNQRGGMDALCAGIFSDTPDWVREGVGVIETTYKYQNSNGTFPGGSSLFWLSWSSHAIVVLYQSPYWETYKESILPLLPKIEKELDALMLNRDTVHAGHGDYESPNRSLINAGAYLFAYIILNDILKTTPQNKLDKYLKHGKAWVDNVFKNDHNYRSRDGIFMEHDGYDTGYQGTALWGMMRILIHFKNPADDCYSKMQKSAQWLALRIRNDGITDCTYNTRSGPNFYYQQTHPGTADKATDYKSVTKGLWYAAATLNQPFYYKQARLCRSKNESINGLTPVLFSDTIAYGKTGEPFNFDILVTNSGQNGITNFNTTISELPSGISSNAPEFLRSGLAYHLKGTPKFAGEYKISISSTNQYGSEKSMTMKIIIENTVSTFVEEKNSREIKIYPNPAKKELFIESNEFQYNQIEIFDMSGRLVQMHKVSFEQKQRLNLSLPNGIYCLKISNSQQSRTAVFSIHNL